MDRLTYEYNPETNQLNHVDDAVISVNWDGELEDQNPNNYQYNAIGQLIRDESAEINIEYNAYGQVSTIKKLNGQLVVEYIYDADGYRVGKKLYNNGGLMEIVYYALDDAGTTLAVYNKQASSSSFSQEELPVYGASRIGVHYKGDIPANDQTLYELSDHLGNVRAVLTYDISGTIPIVASYSDYYPFGWKKPGREIQNGANTYRYGYQGQYAEDDDETDWNAFQLRMYDSRLGRWTSVDPAGQFDSPYVGMGNNPISGTDPDGAYSLFGALWRSALWGGRIIKTNRGVGSDHNLKTKNWKYAVGIGTEKPSDTRGTFYEKGRALRGYYRFGDVGGREYKTILKYSKVAKRRFVPSIYSINRADFEEVLTPRILEAVAYAPDFEQLRQHIINTYPVRKYDWSFTASKDQKLGKTLEVNQSNDKLKFAFEDFTLYFAGNSTSIFIEPNTKIRAYPTQEFLSSLENKGLSELEKRERIRRLFSYIHFKGFYWVWEIKETTYVRRSGLFRKKIFKRSEWVPYDPSIHPYENINPRSNYPNTF